MLQKITKNRFDYPVISSEALRNALRETLKKLKLPCNRERLNDEEQLAVKFKNYPDADRYADDFFMGWMIATKNRAEEKKKLILDESDPRGNDLKENLQRIEEQLTALKKDKSDEAKKKKKKLENEKQKLLDTFHMEFKRDSILRINLAVALEPYRYDNIFYQSPLHVESLWKNAENSQLLHREVTYTPFQYPFALNLKECEHKKDWTKTLLKAIGQLNGVAGNHARSYFEMAPASIVIRLTNLLVAGYSTYGFEIKDGKHLFPEVIDGILHDDYPGNEFYIGGKIVKDMDEEEINILKEKGATLERNPQKLIDIVTEKMFASGE